MAKIDNTYKSICNEILSKGTVYINERRKINRLQIPSYTFRHEFKDGFPAITIKKLFYKSVVAELLWFLNGDNDIKFLNDNGVKIWNQDAYNFYKKHGGELSFEEFEKIGVGSVGQNYSKQWTAYNGNVNQIENLIKDMQSDIMGGRLIVNAWNPSELNKTALPPCHTFFQIIGVPLQNNEYGFELHWHQRSVDTFLGLPFNIASYATLAKILEFKTGYKALAVQGDLKCVHFYDNQIDATFEMLKSAKEFEKCELQINSNGTEIKDFELIGYKSDKAIKVKMEAPITI
jgi:thymidylate synthase